MLYVSYIRIYIMIGNQNNGLESKINRVIAASCNFINI